MSYPLQSLLLELDMSFQLFGELVPTAASTTMLATTSERDHMYNLRCDL